MLTYSRLIIMVTIELLGDRSYGNHISGFIMNATGRHKTLKTGVYPMLQRLWDMGYVEKWVNTEKLNYPDEKLRYNRPFYSLTPAGRAALKESLDEVTRFAQLWNNRRASTSKPTLKVISGYLAS